MGHFGPTPPIQDAAKQPSRRALRHTHVGSTLTSIPIEALAWIIVCRTTMMTGGPVCTRTTTVTMQQKFKESATVQ